MINLAYVALRVRGTWDKTRKASGLAAYVKSRSNHKAVQKLLYVERSTGKFTTCRRYYADVAVRTLTDQIAEGFIRFGPGGGGGMFGRGGGCRNSFEAGTHVLMAEGTTKPIEDVQPGDQVLATDPLTGVTEPKPVTTTIQGHGDKTMVEITILREGEPATTGGSAKVLDDQPSAARVTATHNHPFWDAAAIAWTAARNLEPGDQLLAVDGKTHTVADVGFWATTGATVHNLTVAEIHTYYALVGSTPVLVHNCPGTPRGGANPNWPTTETTWTAAGNLKPGDQLLTIDGDTYAVADVAVWATTGATVYNLTVAETHTYFVFIGNAPVLVHNDGSYDRTSGTIARGQHGVSIQIYANDHGPPHAHLKGRGFDIQIGQNGKPVDPKIQLDTRQQQFVDDNIRTLRSSLPSSKMDPWLFLSSCECWSCCQMSCTPAGSISWSRTTDPTA